MVKPARIEFDFSPLAKTTTLLLPGARIIVGHGNDHHHAHPRAPDLHALDALGADVVHDLRPHRAGRMEFLVFGDLGRVVHQIQREAKAAAHFDTSQIGFGL